MALISAVPSVIACPCRADAAAATDRRTAGPPRTATGTARTAGTTGTAGTRDHRDHPDHRRHAGSTGALHGRAIGHDDEAVRGDLTQVLGEDQAVLGAAAFTPHQHAMLGVAEILRPVDGVRGQSRVVLHHHGIRAGGWSRPAAVYVDDGQCGDGRGRGRARQPTRSSRPAGQLAGNSNAFQSGMRMRVLRVFMAPLLVMCATQIKATARRSPAGSASHRCHRHRSRRWSSHRAGTVETGALQQPRHFLGAALPGVRPTPAAACRHSGGARRARR